MPVCVNMEQCLTNRTEPTNKDLSSCSFARCIALAMEQFGKTSDDADVLLVQTSLQIAYTYATVMVAEYTDLLVLLL